MTACSKNLMGLCCCMVNFDYVLNFCLFLLLLLLRKAPKEEFGRFYWYMQVEKFVGNREIVVELYLN